MAEIGASKKEQMSTKYQPSEVEKGRYQEWVQSGVFKPSGDPKAKPYSIVIPPPNVTGKLHLGHAWDVTLQDMLIRFKRMQGYDTLWLPGMDHAGIATQAKVEAKLAESGLSRYDLGREKFIEKTWEWKEDYASTIRKQWAKMGISVDYDRERFTLDEGLSDAVKKVFVDLYNKGIIYRGEYIINWDSKAQTALSDIEVIHQDDDGAFYYMTYPLTDGSGVVEIATTRPETMLGDTAVAVHPDDPRYQDIIGKTVTLPLLNKEIPVIADSYVDRDFGTGVVKITPAHDPNDFLVGNRHDLPRVTVMNPDATMNENAGKYAGLTREEARKAIVSELKALGRLDKVEHMVHSVGHSERTGVVVEPMLSTQWFVKMDGLAKRAIDNQSDPNNRVDFFPKRFEQTYLTWMENVHDWVISRQLWWGHRIPAWYHKKTGEMYVGIDAPKDSDNWEQDPDVLDTWFSSALWPFSTMGWPDADNPDFKRYFPTDTLVTGYDIIFFWVSRMIFQSLEFTGKRPFKNVLLHGLIRAADGRKMSKSLGNGVDPMDVIDSYGADTLRWFLATGSAPGQDVRYSEETMKSSWNFINKIWNASRFVLLNLEGFTVQDIDLNGPKTLADKWILSRLNEVIQKTTELFDKFEFGEAGRQLYHFIWDDYCDWYIEMAKETLTSDDQEAVHMTKSILAHTLNNILRLLHPIMPFVTEEIWQSTPHKSESIVVAPYPTVDDSLIDPTAVKELDILVAAIKAVRNIRQEMDTPLSKPVTILIKPTQDAVKEMLIDNTAYLERFCHPEYLTISEQVTAPAQAMTAVIDGAEIYLPLAGLIDVDEEIKRLEGELVKLDKEIERIDKKLANESFVSKAPEKIVTKEKEKRIGYVKQHRSVSDRIETLQQN
ncbi:MAG: valine--tRNA ligase [Bavariicoccus seileri]|uniref:valine--tRNA ligase n=1 Tax=Bavariicoccus seileri TaxID=549685 RepID=UPI003F9B9421